MDRNLVRAVTGQRGELLRYNCMYTPCLNGSVFDAFISIEICVGDWIETSC